MPNPEPLARLVERTKAWNVWRSKHPRVRIDLCAVSLPRTNLREADLREANLGSARLGGADLNHELLSMAYLEGADLAGPWSARRPLGTATSAA